MAEELERAGRRDAQGDGTAQLRGGQRDRLDALPLGHRRPADVRVEPLDDPDLRAEGPRVAIASDPRRAAGRDDPSRRHDRPRCKVARSHRQDHRLEGGRIEHLHHCRGFGRGLPGGCGSRRRPGLQRGDADGDGQGRHGHGGRHEGQHAAPRAPRPGAGVRLIGREGGQHRPKGVRRIGQWRPVKRVPQPALAVVAHGRSPSPSSTGPSRPSARCSLDFTVPIGQPVRTATSASVRSAQ